MFIDRELSKERRGTDHVLALTLNRTRRIQFCLLVKACSEKVSWHGRQDEHACTADSDLGGPEQGWLAMMLAAVKVRRVVLAVLVVLVVLALSAVLALVLARQLLRPQAFRHELTQCIPKRCRRSSPRPGLALEPEQESKLGLGLGLGLAELGWAGVS